ncbi:MAG TPA: hypothetical protein DIT25_01140 [Candidatus Moranbacteria bacterium]|nr:hypothetical protein [Candidatus Moranbacteria bacterium]
MKDVLGSVVRKLVELPEDKLGKVYDLLEKEAKLFGDGEWGDEFKKFLRREKCWTHSLLESIGDVKISATLDLTVRDHVVNIREKRNLYTGDNFEKWFFGKKIKPISEFVQYYKLRKGSVDDSILAELGGEAKAETSLGELFALMEMQVNGENGALLTNGYANIFYIKDVDGVLRAVNCLWNGDGWNLSAYEVDYPDEWSAGSQVFSRNSETFVSSETQS